MNRRQQRGGRPGMLVMAFVAALSGCAVLASKEAAIGCQVADIASTEYALRNNANAYETSPLGGNQNLLYALKLGLSWFIWQWEGWKDSPKVMRAAVTVLGCYPVPGNIRLR